MKRLWKWVVITLLLFIVGFYISMADYYHHGLELGSTLLLIFSVGSLFMSYLLAMRIIWHPCLQMGDKLWER